MTGQTQPLPQPDPQRAQPQCRTSRPHRGEELRHERQDNEALRRQWAQRDAPQRERLEERGVFHPFEQRDDECRGKFVVE